MPGVCLNTGALIGIHAEADGGRPRNHGRNDGLREPRQRTDDACGNTARRADAGTAAQFIADTDDIANDHVHESRCLHDADKKQNTGHIRNHGIKT